MNKNIGIQRRASDVMQGPTLKVSNEQALQMLRTKMAQRLSSQASGGELRRSFELLDRDKSGNVELAELEEVFRRFNINLPDNQMRSLMQEFDADGSGRIDFQEFIDNVLQPTVNEQDSLLRSVAKGGRIETLNPGASVKPSSFGSIKKGERPNWLDADGFVKAIKAEAAKSEEDAVDGLRQKLWARFSRYPTITELKDTFRLLDSDRSGKLSKDEVLDAFHQAGFNLSEPQLKHIMTRFDPDGSGLLDMNEFVYELLSPEQRKEEEAAAAEALRRSFLSRNTQQHQATRDVKSSSPPPCPSSALPATVRRQSSPIKNLVSSFIEPPPKQPIEVNKNLCTAFKSISSQHFQSPSSQVLCGSDLKTFNGAQLYTTTYRKATEAVDDAKFEVRTGLSHSKKLSKQPAATRHPMKILRHLGAKLLQRRGGVREFWTAFKFMDLDGSGEVSAEELIKAIKLLNVDMLPEEADDVLEYIKGDDGRVTYTSFRRVLEESVHTLHD